MNRFMTTPVLMPSWQMNCPIHLLYKFPQTTIHQMAQTFIASPTTTPFATATSSPFPPEWAPFETASPSPIRKCIKDDCPDVNYWVCGTGYRKAEHLSFPFICDNSLVGARFY